MGPNGTKAKAENNMPVLINIDRTIAALEASLGRWIAMVVEIDNNEMYLEKVQSLMSLRHKDVILLPRVIVIHSKASYKKNDTSTGKTIHSK